jgi:hypothetical protein
MKNGNWIGLDKNIVKLLPHGRAYTIIEALVSFTIDIDNKRDWTINGYAKQWGWSRNKVRKFANELRTGKGHLADRKGTGSGHLITLKINNLHEVKDTKRTGKGQVEDRKRDTTIYPNPNPNKKKVSSEAPESFTPTEKLLEYFNKESYWKENSQDLIDACFDHHRSKGNKMVDWEAAIKTWCRTDKKYHPKNYESKGGFTIEIEGGVDMEFNSIEEAKAYQTKMAEEASKRTEPERG